MIKPRRRKSVKDKKLSCHREAARCFMSLYDKHNASRTYRYAFRRIYHLLSVFLWSDTDRCQSLLDGRDVSRTMFSPFWWPYLKGSPNAGSRKGLRFTIFGLSDPEFCHRECLENGKSQRYVLIRPLHQVDGTFLKSVALGGSSPRAPP